MTLYDELLALLDLVGSRDCIHGWVQGCNADNCEPCLARELYARMVEARGRVA